MRTVSVTAHSIKNALAEARRALGLVDRYGVIHDAGREALRSGGEDGLYRCHLRGGDIVEVTIIPTHRSEAYQII